MSRIERFYDNDAQYEWDRLERHRTEFAVTMRALGDYLPRPPAKILDVGAGPGRYAIALTQQGYEVTLCDISRKCLEFAEGKAREAGVDLSGCVHANATDLSEFPREGYDAVLLMGPLYHLLDAGEREKAVREARGVLKPGAPVFAAFITRYAPILYAAAYEPEMIKDENRLEEMLATGLLKAEVEGRGFTDAYLAHPSEVKPFMEAGGFETLDVIACEGIVGTCEDKINVLTGEQWEGWVELNYRLGKDPTVWGAAYHLLYVGRKR